ncbi:hypothetical protein JYT19_00085 [Sulfobacillus acidophilus]|uniref:DUF2065 domain-containing protein n=1 Tax=Sulfobacillus acidophilus TaxID=53633 RepID=A0ABS3AV98_9FIRM|nr:hypothetical protein [Sulfobacillus acidophilus]
MVHSIELARILGLFMTVIGLAFLFNKDQMQKAMEDIMKNYGIRVMLGFSEIALGSYLIASHNVWQANWRVIITILAWGFLLEGASFGIFSQHFAAPIKKLIKSKNMYLYGGIFTLALGLVLLYFGLYA